MSATPHANGGELLDDLRLPDFADYAVDVPEPGSGPVSATGTLGGWLPDVIRTNPDNFRMVAPDETASNRLQAVFEATPGDRRDRPGAGAGRAARRAGQFMVDERLRCRRYTREFGEDAPDVADWIWPG